MAVRSLKLQRMSNCRKPTSCDAVAFPCFNLAILRWWSALVAAVLLLTLPAQALEADEWYLQVYGVIEQADTLAKNGQIEKAKAKYLEAEKALKSLKQAYPTYNPKLVSNRLTYLAGKITTLSLPVTDANEKKTSSPGVMAISPGQPQVKLLDAGAEPRKALRLQVKEMNKQKVKLIAKHSMGLSTPEMPEQTVKMPAVSLVGEISIKNISSNGDVAYQVVISEVEVAAEASLPAEAVESVKSKFAAMKGLVVEGLITDRYQVKTNKAVIPSGADAMTRENLEGMDDAFTNTKFILPDEAVGVGAKWEVKQKAKKEGVSLDETIRHELTSIDGELLIVTSTISQSAANQKISNPFVPTMKVEMTAMTGRATEVITMSLNKILPEKATSDESNEMKMNIPKGAKKQAMTMRTEGHSTLETQ